MSRILVVNTPKVKPTRNTTRPAGRFGQGILASVPYHGRQPFTQADLDWLAAQNANEPDWDAMARESALIDAACRSCGAFV